MRFKLLFNLKFRKMKKLDFSKLEKFEDFKVSIMDIRGGATEECFTGNGTTASGRTVSEYCIAFDDGSWDIVFR
jgi:hypothetical protein